MIRLPYRRWTAPLAAILLLGGSLAWYLAPSSASPNAVVARVKRGDFRVTVTTSGELQARKFVQVRGPANGQQAEVYQMRLASIVPEGTIVKEGDVVAELDRSGIAAKLAEVSLAEQKAQAQYTSAQLDSALTLSQAREEIRSLGLAEEEAKIAKQQSTYEAPSIRRQAEINLEKAQRAVVQAKADYTTKTQQAAAKMSEAVADLERQRNKLKIVQDVMQGFTIHAPASGMVIYIREYNGKKLTAGSQVSAWDPVVATLPDLTKMESLTYVNEIDVRKVAAGQQVHITLDADPTKQLTGTVTSVANVGEQRPNSDAKVFEVKITVAQSDTTLRPGMTTSNAIETRLVPNALFVPLEAVSLEGTTPYVFKRTGGHVVRQQIETGAMNDNEIVVTRGLAADDEVLLSIPANAADLETVPLPGGSSATPPASPSTDRAPATPIGPAKADSASATL
jgi:RND family efflux transporter MFP subunit